MKNNKMTIGLGVVLIILVLGIILLLININSKNKFVKPEFDKNVTEIPEKLDYKKNELKISEGYIVYLNPRPTIDNDYLKIDFISNKNNKIWIKVRVFDNNKKLIAESGLLKPGEYLEKVKLKGKVNTNVEITYKIMGYEMDNYLSAGSVSLNTRIGE